MAKCHILMGLVFFLLSDICFYGESRENVRACLSLLWTLCNQTLQQYELENFS